MNKLLNEKKCVDNVDGRRQPDKLPRNVRSSSSSEEEGDEDVVDELPEFPTSYKISRGRHSVSAEVYGEWNKPQNFKAPVYPKTAKQEARIRSVLVNSFMFQHLDEPDLKTVLLAFTEKRLNPGETLIKQGDDGNCLYLIEEGEVDVFKLLPGETEPRHMCVMVPGDAVGELALLYNVPRAATVIAKGNVVLWELDRESFNHIVKDAAARRRELYELFLKEVQIFEGMDPYERNKLSDALKTIEFPAEATIITEGEVGDTFYIIESGKAVAIKGGQIVLEYGRGDYFGELALIRNQPRAATVKAEGGPVKCISLDRRSFKRLLGSVEDILKRQAGRYEEIEKRLASLEL